MSPTDLPPEVPVPLTPAAEAFVPDEYDPLRASQLTSPAPRRPVPRMTRSWLRMWLWVGGLLWAVGLAGWLVLLVQGCEAENGSPAVQKKK
jgi:hypothetical protein